MFLIAQPKIVFLPRSLLASFGLEGAEERFSNAEEGADAERAPHKSFFPFAAPPERRFGDLLVLELKPRGQRFHSDWLQAADFVFAGQLDKAAWHRLKRLEVVCRFA